MFSVGDRVICVANKEWNGTTPHQIGMVGTVIRILGDGRYAVQHDEYHPRLHECAGCVQRGYGWNYELEELALYNDVQPDLDDLI